MGELANQSDEETADQNGEMPSQVPTEFKHELAAMQVLTILKDQDQVKIDMRNMWKDKVTGEDRPTQKGIRMTEETWSNLKSMIEQIDKEIEILKQAPETEKIKYIGKSKRQRN